MNDAHSSANEAKVERMLPLYEAKMIHHYDHRWATFERDGSVRDVTEEEKRDPNFAPMPRYWVRESVVLDRLRDDSDISQFIGVRDICRATDERTVIASMIPVSACGHTLSIAYRTRSDYRLSAVFNSFIFDFVARPKISGVHFSFFIAYQLPTVPPRMFEAPLPWGRGSLGDWIDERVEALTHAPWNPERRALLRAELDAAMFHLYGIARDDVDYIMETFPIVKRHDEAEYGEYRTKRLILEIYDAMAEAMRTGAPYASQA